MTLRFGSIGGDQIQISAFLRSYPACAHRYSNFINETQFSKLHARPIRAPRAPARVSGRGRGRAWMARAGYALECGPHCSLVRGPIQEGRKEGGAEKEQSIGAAAVRPIRLGHGSPSWMRCCDSTSTLSQEEHADAICASRNLTPPSRTLFRGDTSVVST